MKIKVQFLWFCCVYCVYDSSVYILRNFQGHYIYLLSSYFSVIHSVTLYIFSITRYLLEQDFPGMRIGPEPTTDSFIAVMYGESEGSVPGNALVVDPKKPFRKLSRFGNAFLNRWDLVVCYLLFLSLYFYLIPLSSIGIACQTFSSVFILSSVK